MTPAIVVSVQFLVRVSTKPIKINSRIITGFFKANIEKFKAKNVNMKDYNNPV